MLGADARVVEAGRDRVRLDRLAVVVLQQVAAGAVQDAGAAALDRGRVPLGVDPVAGRLVAVELHVGVVEERVEDADRVRSAAHAGRHGIREPAGQLEHLRARLLADDLLEVAHHRRERVRAGRRAEDVVGGLDARDPLAVRLVDRVLQGAGSGRDRHDLGAEQAHAGDVERLALGVDLAHEDRALETEQRGGGRGRDAVLAGAGLGDHALLADALREQRLAEHVVDLVRAGVVEVFALQDDAGAAGVLGEARHLGDDRRAPGVGAVQLGELGLERRVGLRRLVGGRELVDRRDQRLGHEAPAVLAEERAGRVAQAPRVAHAPAARNSCSVATGSSPRTSASPISTTSAPAAR